MFKILVHKQRAPLPPEGTWTYEEQQLWVLVGQSWAENPEERYEIREIKNFLKDLVCDKTSEGPPGGSPSPSPETDSASEAARDLDRVRIWLDGELYGHSTSVVEVFQDWDSSGSYSQQRNSFLSSSRLIFTLQITSATLTPTADRRPSSLFCTARHSQMTLSLIPKAFKSTYVDLMRWICPSPAFCFSRNFIKKCGPSCQPSGLSSGMTSRGQYLFGRLAQRI